jgi:rfaE bifunctional protein kinase chain/domain
MARPSKIRSLDELPRELDRCRPTQRIVHCHGVFDVLHVGHLRHFEQAKNYGDLLVVTLTPDRFVNKGTNRPAFPEDLRAEMIAALDCVDYVAINQWPTAVETIRLLKPHVFAKGSEFQSGKDTTGHILLEQEAIHQHGGEMVFTEDITFSSSALINQYHSGYSREVREYLADFSRRYTAADVLDRLHSARPLKVLVLGEAIIDDYHSCEAIGKSGKEPVLVARYASTERSAGGALACANHLANFCDQVSLVTFLGEESSQEDFIRSRLHVNVSPTFLAKSNSPTIVKTRFMEGYLSQKLFEVYHMNDDPLTLAEEGALGAVLDKLLPEHDLVLVADYGHGMLVPRIIDLVCRSAKFLVVNTQSNAGNHGFNLISKYPRADYVCLAHRELELETRSRRLPAEAMIEHVAHKLNCPRVMLTQGKYGSVTYTGHEGFKRVPALATKVVDRVGAGDAVLCITALCMAQGAPAEIAGFIGNVVGAEAVTILGNQRFIERVPFFRHVECLLKMHQPEQRPESVDKSIRFAA